MRFAPWTLVAVALWTCAPARPAPCAEDGAPAGDDEQTLQAAGLTTDGPALVEFFRTRARADADGERLRSLVRTFADPSSQAHTRAAAELVAWGPLAVPALRHAVNDLESPEAAARARHCLRWLEGPSSDSLPAAAARLLAERKPAGAAAALLAYLPFADNAEVIREVTAALAAVAVTGGQPDPAVLRGLADRVPARRAAACAALCRAGAAGPLPAARQLLRDPNPAVRLRTALALVKANDAEAVPVLIAALGELPAEERRPAEELLQELAGEWAPAGGFQGEDEIARRIRRDAWAAWWRNTEGPSLLAALRKRTPTGDERDRVRALVRRLGDESFEARERASAELVALGPLARPLLREALGDKDLEVVRRAEQCIARIEGEPANRLPAVAFRLLALRKPAGAVEALLAYLPFADDEAQAGEARNTLAALAVRDGGPEPALVRGLADPSPVVRAAAGAALARAGGPGLRPAVRKLLQDAEPAVRLRAALALAAAGERAAVPVLIDLLAVLPADQAGPAQEALYQLAGTKAPEAQAGEDTASRKKWRDAWAAWWKGHGDKVELARLDPSRGWLGYTLLVEVDNGGNVGRVVELGRDNKPRWTVDGLQFPVDAVVLPGNRVLVAEYNGRKVTERDFKGSILWQKEGLNGQAVNVQRLPNGHTFIATNSQLLEVDRAGKEVFSVNNLGGITAAYKARNGHVICLTTAGQCVRLDARGNRLKSFPSNRQGFTSGLDLLPNGRILITQPNRNKVAEVDAEGKVVLEFDAPQVATATALPNGHILVGSMNTQRAFEVDRKGKVVWEYQDGYRIFRARRR